MDYRRQAYLFIVACLFGYALSSVVAARQHIASTPRFPATPLGNSTAALMDAINSGDVHVWSEFPTNRFSTAALADTSPETWTTLLRQLYEQSEGVTPVSIVEEDAAVLSITVRANSSDHYCRLVVIARRSEPDRISQIFVLSAVSPDAQRGLQFPDSAANIADALEIIADQIERRVALDQFSGVVLIGHGDEILLHRAYGMADQSFGIANTLQTRFHLGSMDKMFTGVAIAQLEQAGKLTFDDTIATVLPDFPNPDIAQRVTLHQLLTHTAGTGDFIMNPSFRAAREDFSSTQDYLPIVAAEALQFEPGSQWSYSNSGYVILGAVIEKLSGQSYFDYVREHLFDVAGMSDTGYFELNETVPHRAVGYLRNADEDPFGKWPRRSNVMFIPFKGNSAGGGYSTALDLFRFARALQKGKLLSAEATQHVTAGKVELPGGPVQASYGYGFSAHTVNGRELRGMSGGGPNSGVNSSLNIFWDGSFTVVVVGNYDAPAAEGLNHSICEFLSR